MSNARARDLLQQADAILAEFPINRWDDREQLIADMADELQVRTEGDEK